MNPYYRNQWAKDRELGPTFADRINEVKLVKRQIATMPEDEQTQWVESMEKLIEKDPSPDMRRHAVLALGASSHPRSVAILRKAIQDDSEKVRLSACQALASKKDPESLAMLGSLAQKDASSSVKVAAIKALSNYSGDEAKAILAKAIQDRSPAIQYQSTVSLAKVTGKDFGGDVALWRKYLSGEEVEAPEATLADRLRSAMTLQR